MPKQIQSCGHGYAYRHNQTGGEYCCLCNWDKLALERNQLMNALVTAALPLEAIHLSVEWELCAEIKQSVAEAVQVIRPVLQQEESGGILALLEDKARLDWLITKGYAPSRDVIDTAQKSASKFPHEEIENDYYDPTKA